MTEFKLKAVANRIYESDNKVDDEMSYYRECLAAADFAMNNLGDCKERAVYYVRGKIVVYDVCHDINCFPDAGIAGLCEINKDTDAHDIIEQLRDHYVSLLEFIQWKKA